MNVQHLRHGARILAAGARHHPLRCILLSSIIAPPARIDRLVKALFDLFPIVAFVVTYLFFGRDIYLATKVIMAATAIQMAYLVVRRQPIGFLHVASAVLAWGLGGLSLLLHNPLFIKWKPTIASWMFAAAFIGSQYVGEKPLIQRMFGPAVHLDERGWRQLNLVSFVFYVFLGVVNLYVVYNFSEEFWVKFKLTGLMGFTFAFFLAIGVWLYKKGAMDEPESSSEPDGK
jgi:intracellular septation protein